MKKIFLLIVTVTFLYSTSLEKQLINIEMCQSITSVEKNVFFSDFSFLSPLAFISSKRKPKLGDAKFSKTFQIAFEYGKAYSFSVSTYATNFKVIKKLIEDKFGKKFIFIKSKNKKKMCDYYLIEKDGYKISLTYACGNKNYMSLGIEKKCKRDDL